MKKSKKSMIILISILAVIGITVGGCSMHQYQKKQEMIAIATSDEARKVYEEYLKKEGGSCKRDPFSESRCRKKEMGFP